MGHALLPSQEVSEIYEQKYITEMRMDERAARKMFEIQAQPQFISKSPFCTVVPQASSLSTSPSQQVQSPLNLSSSTNYLNSSNASSPFSNTSTASVSPPASVPSITTSNQPTPYSTSPLPEISKRATRKADQFRVTKAILQISDAWKPQWSEAIQVPSEDLVKPLKMKHLENLSKINCNTKKLMDMTISELDNLPKQFSASV